MNRAFWTAFALFTGAAVWACGGSGGGGGGNPIGPSPNTPVTLTVVSGETSAPVSGARVTSGAASKNSDASGNVSFDQLAANDEVTVEAVGFIKRNTKYRPSEKVLNLIPMKDGLDENYILETWYGNNSSNPLTKPSTADGVSIVISSELKSRNPGVVDAYMYAAEFVSNRNGWIRYGVYDQHVPVMVKIDVGINLCNCSMPSSSSFYSDNGSMFRGEIEYHDVAAANSRSLAIHELAHVFFLGHSSRMGMMARQNRISKVTDFTPLEILSMKVIALRKPGTRFPDDDREVR